MALLSVVNLILGVFNIGIAYFTLREKWRTRRPPMDDPGEVIALRDIAVAIRELKTS